MAEKYLNYTADEINALLDKIDNGEVLTEEEKTKLQGIDLSKYVTEEKVAELIANAQLGSGNNTVNGVSTNTNETFLFLQPLSETYYNGLKYVAIGDSITYGAGASTTSNGYAPLLSNKLGTSFTNYGTSGSTFKGQFSKLSATATAQADLITIALGINDYYQSVELGTLGVDGEDTIYGRVKMWCDKLIELMKNGCNAKIIFLTPLQAKLAFNGSAEKPNSKGVTLNQVRNAIIETCARYRFPVIDMYKYSGFYYNDTDDNNLDTYLADGVHPNDSGHEIMANKLYDYIINNPIYMSPQEIISAWLTRTYPTTLLTLPNVPVTVLSENAYTIKNGGNIEIEVTLTSISVTYNGGDVAVGTNVTGLTGVTVKAHYSNGSNVTITNYTLNGTINEGVNTITVSYEGKTTTFNVTGIVPKTLENISATYSGGNVVKGADINNLKSSLIVTAHYTDGSTENVTNYTLNGTINEGNNIITVTYEGKTATFNVTGYVVSLSSISATYSGSDVETGTNVDTLKSNLVVKATYSDNTTATVTNYTLSGVINEGNNVITVTYEGKTTTFTVVGVVPIALENITATYNGSEVYEGTSVDTLKSNLTVTAHYNNGSTTTIIPTAYTLSGNIGLGSNTITVNYEGKSTTFIVTGVEAPKVVESISVDYDGTLIPFGTSVSDLTGITVTAKYTDGSSGIVTDYTLSGNTNDHVNEITATYGGKTATFLTVATLDNETVNNATLTWTEGEFVENNGTLATLGTMIYCDYYPVKAGEIYSLIGCGVAKRGAMYDKDKNYVQAINAQSFFLTNTSGNDGTLLIPSNVAYVRINCVKTNKPNFSFTKISSYPTENSVTTWTMKDKYYNGANGVVDFAGYTYSKLIPIEAGVTYTITQTGDNSIRYNVLDANGSFINSGKETTNPITLTTPENACFIVFNCKYSKIIGFTMTKTS